jgi:diguanylate cyclase (GGDEF)-like protein
MRQTNNPTNHRLYATLLGLAVLFLAILAGGIYSTVSGINEIERQRNIRLVSVAINTQLDTMMSVADDNALWDAGADAMYHSADKASYVHETWTSSTSNDPYNMVLAIDPAGKVIAAGANMRPIAINPAVDFGTGYEKLITSLSKTTPSVSGILSYKGEIVIVGISRSRYFDAKRNEPMERSGYTRLLFMQRLNPAAYAKLQRQLDLKNLQLVADARSTSHLPLLDPNGKKLGELVWATPNAGFVALRDALPVLITGTLLFFIVLALAGQMGRAMVAGLRYQAMTDIVSKLPNRRAMRHALRALQADETPHALALIDLDGFKAVNDSFGHAVGDQLIRVIAAMLSEYACEDSQLARLGGDEFAVLIAGRNGATQIQNFADALLERLQQPVMVEDRTLAIGASIGLCATIKPLGDEGEMLRRADVAMYQAKRLGKMRAEWFDAQLDEAQTIANHMAGELRESLEKGDIEVVYQPIVSANDGTWNAVEALARWTSPSQGPVGPDIFVPIAENSGLIDGIGLFVLRRACQDLKKWSHLDLAVNVSAAQLKNPAFPDKVKAILEETGFSPRRLQLEITETYLIADTALAQKVIEGVADLGVMIALDDFGTGYASVGFLRQFAFGKLKIDRGLVAEAMDDPGARVLLQVSVAAARALDMIVTAEGIEDAGQADLMRVIGCDELQGWHFGYPADIIKVEKAMSAMDADNGYLLSGSTT